MQARVLIVDDHQDILSALKKRLTWMGHDVLTAENGEQALKLISEDQPDLILLDIELPGLSALDILKRLSEKRLQDKKGGSPIPWQQGQTRGRGSNT